MINQLRQAVLLVVTLTVVAACDKSPNSSSSQSYRSSVDAPAERNEEAVSKAELLSTLESRNFDAAITMFNRVKRMNYKGDILPTILDLWSGHAPAGAKIDMSFVSHPRIRLEIADVLIQAARNGARGIPRADISQYARDTLAQSNDVDVIHAAITVLGLANEQKDVKRLTEIALLEDDWTFRYAVLALVGGCWMDAAGIQDIAKKLKSSANREIIETAWTQHQEWRKALCEQANRN